MLRDELRRISGQYVVKQIVYENDELRLKLLQQANTGRNYMVIHGNLSPTNVSYLTEEGLRVQINNQNTPDVGTVISWED